MTSLNRGMLLTATFVLAACGGGGGVDGGTCTTNADCTVTGQICQRFDTHQCEAKCESAGDCSSGFLCEATTGECYANTVADAGTDGGMVATTCNKNATQPDVCGHTRVCTTADTCEAVTDGTCANVTQATRTTFTSASTGPVIFNIVDAASGADDDSFCASGTAFTGTIYAYAATGSTFGATGAGLPAGFYYKGDGSFETIQGKFRPSGYTQIDGGRMMSLKFTLCSTNATSLVAAFGFENGNGYCVTLAR